MALLLDGKKVPGYDQRVKSLGQLAREDQSGESSGTGSSHKGWKAWVIGVSCRVRFKDAEDLVSLRRLFQARTDELGAFELDAEAGSPGVPRLYVVSDALTDALGVTHARFSDYFQADPDERGHFWHVKFTLIEERSKPELTAERTAPAPAATPGPPPDTTDTAGQPAESLAPQGWTGAVLSLFDKFASLFVPGS